MIVDSVYFVKDLPQHYHQLKDWPDPVLRQKFYDAVKRENDSLRAMNTYEVIPLSEVPPGVKLVPVRYVFTSNPLKSPSEKARLCVRGDQDDTEHSLADVFSTVTRSENISLQLGVGHHLFKQCIREC